MHRVIWTDPTLANLDEAAQFYSKYSIIAARNLLSKVFSKTKLLEEFPKMGQRQPELCIDNQEFRYIVEANYKIIYKVLDNQVFVMDFFNTRQDPSNLNQRFSHES